MTEASNWLQETMILFHAMDIRTTLEARANYFDFDTTRSRIACYETTMYSLSLCTDRYVCMH